MRCASMEHLISAALATGIAELVTVPVCTLKTRYQNAAPTAGFASPLDLARKMVRQEGLVAFYRASVPAMATQVFSTASKWYLYRYLLTGNNKQSSRHHHQQQQQQANSSKKNNNGQPFIQRSAYGIISSVSVSVATHPMDWVRVQLQMNQSKNYVNLIREHGLLVLYRGYSKTLTKATIGGSLFFPIRDHTHDFLERDFGEMLTPKSLSFLSSLTSAVGSTMLMQPFDYLKTRQLYGNDASYLRSVRQSRASVFSTVSKLYTGLGLNLIRIVPHFTIVMTCNDMIYRYIIEYK